MARSVIIIGDGEEEGGGEGAGATAICDALPRSAKKADRFAEMRNRKG